LKIRDDLKSSNLINYSKDLKADIGSVRKSLTPQKGTLVTAKALEETESESNTTSDDTTQSDASVESSASANTSSSASTSSESTTESTTESSTVSNNTDDVPISCGAIQDLGNEATDQSIIDFHKCKVSLLIDKLQSTDRSKFSEAQSTRFDEQIAQLQQLLANFDIANSSQAKLIAGSRDLIAVILNGQLQQYISDRESEIGNPPPLPNAEQRCAFLKENLNSSRTPSREKERMQDIYDRHCSTN
jgi:hypothetical protein